MPRVIRYRVAIERRAEKFLAKLNDVRLKTRLLEAIDALADSPRPHVAKKMAGTECRYRIRVGDYRIIYEIEADAILVLVVDIGHRREIYT